MKIIDHFNQTNKTLFSFELLPPLKGDNIESIYKTIDPLIEFNPPYINVTYHKEEVVFKELDNGLLQKKVVRKRPGTVAISAAIMNKYKKKDVYNYRPRFDDATVLDSDGSKNVRILGEPREFINLVKNQSFKLMWTKTHV